MMKVDNTKIPFTFIEMAFSLAMLTILIIAALQLFKTSTDALSKATDDKEAYRNARIAFDMISRDLNSVYYTNTTIPFWHKPYKLLSDPNIPYSNELLAFVTQIQTTATNSAGVKNFNKIKYQLWYDNSSTLCDSSGWLMRSMTSCTGSGTGSYTDTSVAETGSGYTFTANNDSCNPYDLLIPYVLTISFNCLDPSRDIVDSTRTTEQQISTPNTLPYTVEIVMTVLDKNTWAKWISLGGSPAYYSPSTGTWSGEPVPAKTLRENHQKTFTRSILIGDRGQYNQ